MTDNQWDHYFQVTNTLTQILITFHRGRRYCTTNLYAKMSSISSRRGFLGLCSLFSFRSSAVVRELEGCLARCWFFTTAVSTRDEGPGV
jgi:hypothetical protein